MKQKIKQKTQEPKAAKKDLSFKGENLLNTSFDYDLDKGIAELGQLVDLDQDEWEIIKLYRKADKLQRSRARRALSNATKVRKNTS